MEIEMSLAKLLAVVDGGSGSEAAVTAALDFGRRFSARVELLHVEIEPESAVPMVGEGMSGAAVEQRVQSRRAEADLLVMGAHGHSRLREMVLGEVTRGVLSDADIPVFLMH
jgi:nucleotide-binding universal stress UspA family protein